jgi:predicted anti-sigma-YlaC factor YlaD
MRGAISAELDGELSELEASSVHSHVGRCEPCRAFQAEAARFATALRGAPLEPLRRPVTVPSRRWSVVSLRVPAAAAVAVSMIAAGGVFETLHSGAVIHGSRSSATAFDDQTSRALQLQSTKAAFADLLVRKAQLEANKIPRHPGFQNP